MKDDHVYPRQTDLGPRPGMELRDWVAGMVLQGKLAGDRGPFPYTQAAEDAYAYADAMIEQRNKEQN